MAAAMRSVRRLQQVLLLPRMMMSGVRAQSGGKGSPHAEYIKTLVSFPVKVSYVQQQATGENRDEPPRPLIAPLLHREGLGGESDREKQPGQDVPSGSVQSVDGTSNEDESSSSSSSDSSSDSEGEDEGPLTDLQGNEGESGPTNLQGNEVKSGGGLKGLSPAGYKSAHSPGHIRLGKERRMALEQKDRIGMRGASAEDVAEDPAPVVTTEEQSLHVAPLPTNTALTEADKMETSDQKLPTEKASAMETASLKETKSPSISEEHLAEGAEAKLMETKILSTPLSEELPPGEVETSASESVGTQILSPTTSDVLPVEAKKSIETQTLFTLTSEELPVEEEEEEAAELYESYSPQEPRAAPHEFRVAPQEPFDNTNYQNLQHFTYTPFTFVDEDVELAKYRLPQPSSGRPSPRH